MTSWLIAWAVLSIPAALIAGRLLARAGRHYPPVPEAAQGGVAQGEGAAPSCGAAEPASAEQHLRAASGQPGRAAPHVDDRRPAAHSLPGAARRDA